MLLPEFRDAEAGRLDVSSAALSLGAVLGVIYGLKKMAEGAAVSSPLLQVLPLSVDVAIESEHLGESFPSDPADRLITATARVHDLTLITSDRPIRKSRAARTLW